MAATKYLIFVCSCLIVFRNVLTESVTSDIHNLIGALVTRIESLESNEAANKAEIVRLVTKIEMMERDFKRKENEMSREINDLKTMVSQKGMSHGQQPMESDVTDERQPIRSAARRTIKRQVAKSRQVREFPENEVAFYATHSEHDIHHLGVNQILQFQQVITNIGQAYNNSTGAFRAPVGGTYVFHATVLGIDIKTANHMYAHFAVDGTPYSRFWVTGGDQSSQMFVVDLKPGQTVSVRNDFADEGFVGQHFSTFSGFLLYQHMPSTGSIIGK
ncbi:Complement C1q-like protein 4 [Mactra antiquata]